MQNSVLIGLGSAFLIWKAYKMGYFDVHVPQVKVIKQKESNFMSTLILLMALLYLLSLLLCSLKDKLGEIMTKSKCLFKDMNIDCCLKTNICTSPCNTNDTNTNNTNKTDYVDDITNDKVVVDNTKDIKISSESLGQNNVVVYKVITDNELDDDMLNLEEETETPKMTISKLNKPLKKKRKFNKKKKTEVVLGKQDELKEENNENIEVENNEEKLENE